MSAEFATPVICWGTNHQHVQMLVGYKGLKIK
jgi:hypothetical protein